MEGLERCLLHCLHNLVWLLGLFEVSIRMASSNRYQLWSLHCNNYKREREIKLDLYGEYLIVHNIFSGGNTVVGEFSLLQEKAYGKGCWAFNGIHLF